MGDVTSQVRPNLQISKLWLHNWVLHLKLSASANFWPFIPFHREVIDMWHRFGAFLGLNGQRGVIGWSKFANLQSLAAQYWGAHPKVSASANFWPFIPFHREVIDICHILGEFLGLNGTCDVTGRSKFTNLQSLTAQLSSSSKNYLKLQFSIFYPIASRSY